MKIKAFIERENREKCVDIKEGSAVLDLLGMLRINPVTVVTSINKEMVTEDYKLTSKDKEIYIHSVISGG